MRLGIAIECLFDNYVYASDKEWIRDKVAWALYQTWKEADNHKESEVSISSKDESQKCYLEKSCDHYGDKQVCGRCREYNLYSHTKTEPQTDIEIARAIQTYERWLFEEPQTDCSWKRGK